jgi:hypothetical protein
MHYPAPYAYSQPPRRRRGLKRTVFGGLGLLANAIGLVVMPFVAGFIALVVAALGSMEMTPLDAREATFQGSSSRIYTVTVPAADVTSTTCEIEGEDITVTPGDPQVSTGQVDGVDYFNLYNVTVHSDQEVSVRCEGAGAVALWEMGMAGTLISVGVGILLPVLLGLASLALTIWGIIALVRSR